MQVIRKADQRGKTQLGWLDGRHSFSFGRYQDPTWQGFGPLRVINDDRIAPGGGFDTHPHRDMEIITYVLDGAIAHQDSTGGGGEITPGEVQRMSAGTGVRHSEFNASKEHAARMLQIWIEPDATGHEPRYGQIRMDPESTRGALATIVSPDGRAGSLAIYQDAVVRAGRFDGDERASVGIERGRKAWVQVARGRVVVNGEQLEEGDGLALGDATNVDIERGEDSEVLVFDLAG